jgi:hypothetical protein
MIRFSSLPIFVGGLAIYETVRPLGFDTINAIVVRNIALIDIVKTIRSRVTPKSSISRTMIH